MTGEAIEGTLQESESETKDDQAAVKAENSGEGEYLPARSEPARLVVMRNELVYANYTLSTPAQKVLVSLISMINPRDNRIPKMEFTAPEFAALMGVSVRYAYKLARTVTRELQSLTMTIKGLDWHQAMDENNEIADFTIVRRDDEASYINVNPLDYSGYDPDSGLFRFRWRKGIEPYLQQIRQNYTQYMAHVALSLTSASHIRLYELLRASLSMKDVQRGITVRRKAFDYQTLRGHLGIGNRYKRFFDFERQLLQVCQREFEQTDLRFTYRFPDRENGRPRARVRTIVFEITPVSHKTLIANLPDWQATALEHVPKGTLDRLIKEFGEDRVQRNVEMVVAMIQDEPGRIKKPAAYLRKATRSDYAEPTAEAEEQSQTRQDKREKVRERLRDIGDIDW